MSTSPAISAATRVAFWPIGVKIASVTLLSMVPHQLGLRTRTVLIAGWRSLSMNGPVPLAFRLA